MRQKSFVQTKQSHIVAWVSRDTRTLSFFAIVLNVVFLLIACTPSPPAPSVSPLTAGSTPSSASETALEQAGAPPASDESTPIPVDTTPRVIADNTDVNLRTGPGTNYDRVGVLPQGESLEVVGRNADASWWQVTTLDGLRWIAANVTTATNVDAGIPVVLAPPTPTNLPPPPPTLTPPPTPSPAPQYQYTVRNIFGQVNEAITQIRGDIRDANGNPINGVRVRVRAGSFCTVSFPSGPQGGYPNGGYDVLLDNRAKEGQWQVAIVNGPIDPNNTQCNPDFTVLSEEVTVPTNTLEGVVFVEWRRNF